MEYCSPLWAGAPASHLSRLHAVETKAFRIIGISRDEAESLGLSLSHRRLVGGLSVFYRLLSSLAPPALSAICPHHISAGRSRSANNPLLVKLPKSLLIFTLSFLFFPAFGINSHTVFNPIFPSRPSKQLFTTTSYHPPSKSSIFCTPLINYPPKPTLKFPAFLLESPCNVHLVYPVFPTPSLSLPQIS